jgi:hypothetical protein
MNRTHSGLCAIPCVSRVWRALSAATGIRSAEGPKTRIPIGRNVGASRRKWGRGGNRRMIQLIYAIPL